MRTTFTVSPRDPTPTLCTTATKDTQEYKTTKNTARKGPNLTHLGKLPFRTQRHSQRRPGFFKILAAPVSPPPPARARWDRQTLNVPPSLPYKPSHPVKHG
jgi:hypothetical protein